jgi:hypothetical protein
MRLVFFTEDEALMLAPMLDGVLAECREHECQLFAFRRPGAGMVQDLRWALHTFGFAYTLRTGAEYLYCRLLEFGERLGLRWDSSPNAPEVIAALRAFAPDVLVSIACPRVLDKAVLAVPRLSSLNVHGGRLPAYRGRHSAFWQLYHGEKTGVTTVHVMAADVDAGPIVTEEPWHVNAADTWHDVMRKSRAAGVPALVRALKVIERERVAVKPSAPLTGRPFGKPTREHVRRLRARGVRLR